MENLLEIYRRNFAILAEAIGSNAEELGFLMALIFNVVFGVFMKKINSHQMRLLVSLVLGIFIQYYVFGPDIIYSFIATLGNYVLLRTFGHKAAMPCFVFSMATLWSIHIRSMYRKYANWDLDINVVLMMNTPKYTSLPFNLKDGLKPPKHLSHYQKSVSITKCPSIFEYFSYVYFYPTAICGPFFEFKDFKQFIYKEERFSHIPSTLIPTLKTLGISCCCLAFVIFAKPYANIEMILTEEYQRCSLIYKLIWFLGPMMRVFIAKYELGFYMTESACRACGVSYYVNPLTKEVKWNNYQSVYLELNLHEYAHNHALKWNCSVGKWLKRYVYVRGLSLGLSKTVCFFGTFFVSCFWHGFYPGYYLCFAAWAFAQKTSPVIKKTLEKIFGTNNAGGINVPYLVKVLFLIPYHMTFVPTMLPFYFMTWERSMLAYKAFPLWIILMPFYSLPLWILIEKMLPPRKNKKVAGNLSFSESEDSSYEPLSS